MKMKKVIVVLLTGILLAGLFSSCAIDRKCPAYSKVSAETVQLPA